MSLLNNDEASAFVDKVHRDRSFSDAHDLVYSMRHARHSNDDTPMITVGTDADSAIDKAKVIPSCNKMTLCGNKKHHSSRQHHQHHGNNRPRSKSLDVHRHSTTPVHKKKYAHHPMHPRTQSPGGGHQHLGRNSPTVTTVADNMTPRKLQGKMWIRPAATSSPVPLSNLAHAALAAKSPVSHGHQAMIDDGVGFRIISHPPTLNDSPSPTARQVTDGSCCFPSPDSSFDDEMLLSSSATYPNSSSSFDLYQRMQGHGHTTRIIFGESGKPIKPRTAYLEQFTPI